MSRDGFTPGPWHANEWGKNEYKGQMVKCHANVFVTTAPPGTSEASVVAMIHACNKVDYANAKLISAAPSLLSACRAARSLFSPSSGLGVGEEAKLRRVMAMSPQLKEINEAIEMAVVE